ncbi:MAG: DUF4962 domain-containing protein [Verrucomicrobia bacterium]|nr:DUF4962 domain-containing protein [Verrucomicrobiota bacterium]MCH8525605.1 DUF4962 domain-containing protein [Kiritimatiellia bacterium]
MSINRNLVSCAGVFILLAACTPRRPSPVEADPPPETVESAEDYSVFTGPLIPDAAALQPYNSSWDYSPILNRRPGDGMEVTINPPRFSWPYLPDILAEDIAVIPPNVFTLEIAADPAFADPAVRVKDTPYNFYNALEPLEPGTWYWRVGYGPQPELSWSAAQSFVVTEDTPVWDRAFIHSAAETLRGRTGSRTLPPGTDWRTWNDKIAEHPDTRMRHQLLLREADRVMALPWWDDMPESDLLGRGTRTREERTRWVGMLKNASVVAYAYRLTGDAKYAGAISRVLHMAAWPPGGLLSPENLGGQTKMPSQAVELFAAVYDWFRDEWNGEQREIMRETVRWRLEQTFFAPSAITWQNGDNMRHYGLAYSAGSHPYQNYAWALPAIMLMAGELEIADQLLELSLHYLTGVTIPDGPEEGYNEGHGYSNEKAGTLLDAALVVEILLPEVRQGLNPAIQNLVDWFAYMFSGPEVLPWGDSWLGTSRGIGDENLRKLSMLTGSPLANTLWRYRGRGEYLGNVRSLYNRPWFELLAWEIYKDKLDDLPPGEIGDTLFLPKAGWVFTHSRPILTLEDYNQAVGMQFQMRPRGGYGHSFASDGSFAWFAHGQVLSAGGGWRSWASLSYSRSPLSHNSLLVNGTGHDVVDPYQPQRPLAARPLAFEQGENFTYWAADLTPGYLPQAAVERVHRHVLFVEGRWFVIYDELAAPEPSVFTWLFHVEPDVPMRVGTDRFRYEVNGVQAEVRFLQPSGSLRIEHARGRETYVNPETGEDHFPADIERVKSRDIFSPFLNRPHFGHSLRVRNAEPARSFHFLSVLNAAEADGELAAVEPAGEKRLRLQCPDGSRITISFDPARPGDLTVDPARVVTTPTPKETL